MNINVNIYIYTYILLNSKKLNYLIKVVVFLFISMCYLNLFGCKDISFLKPAGRAEEIWDYTAA